MAEGHSKFTSQGWSQPPPTELPKSLTEFPWQHGDLVSRILVQCSQPQATHTDYGQLWTGAAVCHKNEDQFKSHLHETLCSLCDPRQASVFQNPALQYGGKWPTLKGYCKEQLRCEGL